MKYKLAFILFFLLCLDSSAQNDCTDALTVCGNTGYQGLTATGFGIQELNNTNTCQSQENNSLWLKLPINTGGTLGFILTPSSPSIVVDFDFFVFGPSATCGNLGQAIRCSTTNPEASGAFNNHTGMNENETDTAEGPGQEGNNFVQWLTVQDGETYFLVIDRPIGSSDFSIQWTGTATFYDAAVFNNPAGLSLDINQCDDDATDDQKSLFDLTVNAGMLTGIQGNTLLTYHLTPNDAITGENAVLQPEAFVNTANPQEIHMRMTNTVTGCFTVESFSIEVVNTLVAGQPQDLMLCDFKENGLQEFDLTVNDALVRNGNPNTSVTYYASQQDAVNEANAITGVYQNESPYVTQTIWVRLENISGCFGSDIKQFTITVTPLPDIVYTLDIIDFRNTGNSISIVMPDAQYYQFSTDGAIYSDNTVFNNLLPGIHTIYIQAKSGCRTISEEIVILNYPRFFSPNADGMNDIWQIPYLAYSPGVIVTIFDRYGKIVGRLEGNAGWDGAFNGKTLPATDYWFVLQLDNNRIIKGHFAMIR